jgi:hypothetical protein
MKIKTMLAFVSVGILMMGGSACTVAQFHRIGPQTHFTYPNSNVKVLGPVKVQMKGPGSWFAPSIMTGETDEKLYQLAMAKVNGSNLLIDYVRTTTVYQWPLPQIFWTQEELEATAAQMEVGQQTLR